MCMPIINKTLGGKFLTMKSTLHQIYPQITLAILIITTHITSRKYKLIATWNFKIMIPTHCTFKSSSVTFF